AIDEGLQLGPAVKAVAAGERELRIVESKGSGISVAVEAVHFPDRIWVAADVSAQQFLGLAFQLFQVGGLRQSSGRNGVFHNELVSIAPGVRWLGQKRVHCNEWRPNQTQGDSVPFRGHGGALKRQGQHSTREKEPRV